MEREKGSPPLLRKLGLPQRDGRKGKGREGTERGRGPAFVLFISIAHETYIKSRLSLLMQFIAECVSSLSTLHTRSEVAFVLFL